MESAFHQEDFHRNCGEREKEAQWRPTTPNETFYHNNIATSIVRLTSWEHSPDSGYQIKTNNEM